MRSCDVPVESRQNYLTSTIALGFVAFVTGVVRLFARWRLEHAFKTDDYIMIAVLVCTNPIVFFRAVVLTFLVLCLCIRATGRFELVNPTSIKGKPPFPVLTILKQQH